MRDWMLVSAGLAAGAVIGVASAEWGWFAGLLFAWAFGLLAFFLWAADRAFHKSPALGVAFAHNTYCLHCIVGRTAEERVVCTYLRLQVTNLRAKPLKNVRVELEKMDGPNGPVTKLMLPGRLEWMLHEETKDLTAAGTPGATGYVSVVYKSSPTDDEFELIPETGIALMVGVRGFLVALRGLPGTRPLPDGDYQMHLLFSADDRQTGIAAPTQRHTVDIESRDTGYMEIRPTRAG